jgi:hypothetical protein
MKPYIDGTIPSTTKSTSVIIIKTHLAHNKQANKPKENKNGNQDALSHHHQPSKANQTKLSAVDGDVKEHLGFHFKNMKPTL